MPTVPPAGVIYVMIGDSLTRAYTNPDTMIDAFGAVGISPIFQTNRGESGASLTVSWDVDLDPEDFVADAVAATEALEVLHPGALVVWSVMLGTNDVPLNATAGQMVAGMEKLIDLCESNGWLLEIKLPPFNALFSGAQDALLVSYRAPLLALVNGVTVFQGDTTAYATVKADPSLLVDGVHYTYEGYLLQAEWWAEAALAGVFSDGLEIDTTNLNTTTLTIG